MLNAHNTTKAGKSDNRFPALPNRYGSHRFGSRLIAAILEPRLSVLVYVGGFLKNE